ncbi:histidine kinase [Aquiflexum sp. TKW24L]|uniref:sensor histidine kinase n=1 Tax=Aquiflexum sp. TKW24L TaxID=2942212 RepID=UPI0020C0BEF6|nr:histidine kinase [Aquiflexum sp. TKW24L]MCL6259932.1 histidine kinase [Aquiflexum sp. TKW24L]
MLNNELDALKVLTLLDNVASGLMVLDGDEKIIYINQQASVFLGVNQNKVCGKEFSTLKIEPLIFDLVSKFKSDNSTSSLEVEMLDGTKLVCVGVKIFGQGNSVILYFDDITERKEIGEKYRQDYLAIKNLNSQSQKIREDERALLSREIHDQLGQRLTGMKMEIDFILKKSPDLDDFAKEKLHVVLKQIERTVSTIRNISRNLRPGILDDFGLLAALEWQAEEFTKSGRIPIFFQYEGVEKPMDNQKATAVFRVFQECLTNIMRHSKCSHVKVGVFFKSEGVWLSIFDNGLGFDPIILKDTKSLGILGMQERAESFGGDFKIQSAHGEGTKITLFIPY